ncbi:MAG: phosphoribosylaminoimidazolesuccinocarboxamide synthase [Candidatus Daviesbacteria bacterium]|nr:phosphoribosylaminoimidazolesuccinocarboxamide synthase [Candidatus Daviesbacteria bacterium]
MATRIESLLESNSQPIPRQYPEDNIGPLLPNGIFMHTGKVRTCFQIGDKMVMVASDGISTYDVVHPNPVGGKGIVLTQMSAEWMDGPISPVMQNHLLSTHLQDMPAPFRDIGYLAGRVMLVELLKMDNAEFVVRGYLTGSAKVEYDDNQTVCGIKLPPGLREADKFPEPIFTPATKAKTGHDQNIDFETFADIIGDRKRAERLRDKALELYTVAGQYALDHGIIIADTKFEIGRDSYGNDVLGDEVLTPDSSRFWDFALYQPGKVQPSLDKQYVRDWARETGWDRNPPAPVLPEKVVGETQIRYINAYNRLFPDTV